MCLSTLPWLVAILSKLMWQTIGYLATRGTLSSCCLDHFYEACCMPMHFINLSRNTAGWAKLGKHKVLRKTFLQTRVLAWCQKVSSFPLGYSIIWCSATQHVTSKPWRNFFCQLVEILSQVGCHNVTVRDRLRVLSRNVNLSSTFVVYHSYFVFKMCVMCLFVSHRARFTSYCD